MSSPDFSNVQLVCKDHVAILTLNRPMALNALSVGLLDDLRAALEVVAKDDQVRVLLMTGAGRGFCAGADLLDLLEKLEGRPDQERTGDRIAAMMYSTHNRLINALWEFPKPVVTAVNGVAAGGGLGLALTADIVVAARSASFASVFANQLGIAPDMGTSFHLQRLVGRARALRMAFLGEKISADLAAEWGLIAEVVEGEALMTRALEISTQLTRQDAKVFVRTRQGLSLAENASLSTQLAWEAETQRELCSEPAFVRQVDEFAARKKAG